MTQKKATTHSDEPTPRSWSLDEFIDAYTQKKLIKTPFTQAERDLAQNLASAYYYYHHGGELPDRALQGRGNGFDFFTPELTAFHMGIFRVQVIHGEFPELNIT
jgi:hypothetical protein